MTEDKAPKCCPICGKEIPEGSGNHRKYCSNKCSRAANRDIKEISDRACKMAPIREQIFQAYGCRCAICGWRGCDEPGMVGNNGHHQWACMNQIHHIIPVSKGGGEDVENLILLCPNHHKMADLGAIAAEHLQEIAKAVAMVYFSSETSPEKLRVTGRMWGQYWREFTLKALKEKGLEKSFTGSESVCKEMKGGTLAQNGNFRLGYFVGYDVGVRKGHESTIERLLEVANKQEVTA